MHLTAAGWLFLVLTCMVGVSTTRNQAPLGFLLFGSMLGAEMLSAVVAWSIVRRVQLRRECPPRAWQNQTTFLTYLLRNRRRRPCLGLRVEERRLKGADVAAGHCVHLAAGQVFRAGARLAARRRGRLALRDVAISTSFPFGLVRARRIVRLEGEMTVWPARGRLTRELLRRGAVQASMAAPAPRPGGQDEFFGLREYREGDSPRWVHWRRSASRALPVVREMALPRPEVLYLVLDTEVAGAFDPARAQPGKAVPPDVAVRERALRFAATLLEYAFSHGYRAALAVGDAGGRPAAYAPAAGVAQRTALLDALAAVTDKAPTLRELLAAVPPADLKDAQVILLSLNAGRLAGLDLRRIRAAGGSLTVLTGEDLPAVFEDDALSGEGPK